MFSPVSTTPKTKLIAMSRWIELQVAKSFFSALMSIMDLLNHDYDKSKLLEVISVFLLSGDKVIVIPDEVIQRLVQIFAATIDNDDIQVGFLIFN